MAELGNENVYFFPVQARGNRKERGRLRRLAPPKKPHIPLTQNSKSWTTQPALTAQSGVHIVLHNFRNSSRRTSSVAERKTILALEMKICWKFFAGVDWRLHFSAKKWKISKNFAGWSQSLRILVVAPILKLAASNVLYRHVISTVEIHFNEPYESKIYNLKHAMIFTKNDNSVNLSRNHPPKQWQAPKVPNCRWE